MSRPVHIVATLALFTAIMVGLGYVIRPVVNGAVDWLVPRIGVEWAWAGFLAVILPPGLWAYWQSYLAAVADRTRSP